MISVQLRVRASLGAEWIAFLQEKLGHFDIGGLQYVHLYDRTGSTRQHGVWGRCAFPNRKKRLRYRIRCSVAIAPTEFPYPAKWPIGSREIHGNGWEWIWREDQFQRKEEAFIWIAGHEVFHWLRHSRQILGQNYETQANRYGFAWLDDWRMIVGPQEVAGPRHKDPPMKVDTSKARIYYVDGQVSHYTDKGLAKALWKSCPEKLRVAYRGANDRRPVHPWDTVEGI